MIKCSCDNPECKISINFDGNRLLFTSKEGIESYMYLDANAIQKLVHRLRKELLHMVFEKEAS